MLSMDFDNHRIFKMNYYQHNIADFNELTRHLTRVERSVYRDSIDLYLKTERPLSVDISFLERKLLCNDAESKTALSTVLDEFFAVTNGYYRNVFCDKLIAKHKLVISAHSRAGRASAESRRLKALSKKSNTTKET